VSALTKTFVLLHVVMSMLLAAGLIVFVNRVDDFQASMKSTTANLRLAEQRSTEANAELATVKSTMANVQQTSQARIQQIQAEMAQRDQAILDLRGQLAEAQAQTASAQAALTSNTEALKVAQQNQGTLQGQLAQLRTTHDKLMQQFTEANLSINDISARLNQTERQRRDLAEQVAAQNETLENRGANRARTDSGGTAPGEAGQASSGLRSSVNVNGVVREKRLIAGVPYATISIGSADAVQRGMRLRVLGGRNGQEFLGYVDVTQVEPDEAIGRLTGPRINEVGVNSQVVSQL
jgi:multidrug efflux pump subunit AcrA (membrane-fusion protein)